jgi:hypothetical protein
MPGPELQVRQALPKPWAIGYGRRLSVERADFATIPWATGESWEGSDHPDDPGEPIRLR